MICNAEARERRTELLQCYYDQFSATLKQLGYLGRIPTLHDFNVEILRNGIVGKNPLRSRFHRSLKVSD